MPHLFLSVLGMSPQSAQARHLISSLPGPTVQSEPDAELNDRSYISAADSSVDLVVDGRQTIITTVMINLVAGESGAFQGVLPHNFSPLISRKRAYEVLGPPAKTGGPVQAVLNSDILYWDLWHFEGYKLHLEYPESQGRLNRMTLSMPE